MTTDLNPFAHAGPPAGGEAAAAAAAGAAGESASSTTEADKRAVRLACENVKAISVAPGSLDRRADALIEAMEKIVETTGREPRSSWNEADSAYGALVSGDVFAALNAVASTTMNGRVGRLAAQMFRVISRPASAMEGLNTAETAHSVLRLIIQFKNDEIVVQDALATCWNVCRPPTPACRTALLGSERIWEALGGIDESMCGNEDIVQSVASMVTKLAEAGKRDVPDATLRFLAFGAAAQVLPDEATANRCIEALYDFAAHGAAPRMKRVHAVSAGMMHTAAQVRPGSAYTTMGDNGLRCKGHLEALVKFLTDEDGAAKLAALITHLGSASKAMRVLAVVSQRVERIGEQMERMKELCFGEILGGTDSPAADASEGRRALAAAGAAARASSPAISPLSVEARSLAVSLASPSAMLVILDAACNAFRSGTSDQAPLALEAAAWAASKVAGMSFSCERRLP